VSSSRSPAKAAVQSNEQSGPRPPPGRTGVRFAGYAAVFDRPDRGGDVVRAGAFARSLGRGRARVPLLWQHDAGRPIGRIEYLKEDRRGLRVIARLSEGTAGREAAALLKEGAVRGLSFGYRVRAASGKAPRELRELDLVEVSLVTLPMQRKARVHAVDPGIDSL
jgi:HK97 family phage prohead protease